MEEGVITLFSLNGGLIVKCAVIYAAYVTTNSPEQHCSLHCSA